MKLPGILILFACLLIVSTATSFLGYRYLSLAGIYRGGAFAHLDQTQRLIDLIEWRSGLTAEEVKQAKGHVTAAFLRVQACTDNRTNVETQMFLMLGAGNAFDLCEDAAATAKRALAILDRAQVADGSAYALKSADLFDLRREAALMREESVVFQPMVNVLEQNWRRLVTYGTMLAALGLSVIFLFASNELWRAWRGMSRQKDELVVQHRALEEANQKIQHVALHDTLTGLPNRHAFEGAFQNLVTEKADITLIRVDLDHFKSVNDTMGHEAGDFMLKSVASKLSDEMRGRGMPSRIGGDEFVVLMTGDASEETAMQLCDQLLERISKPVSYGGRLLQVGSSFGVASSSSQLVDYDALNVAADAALYHAKDSGRNRACLYSPALHSSIMQKRDFARELKNAIRNNEFIPYFQPQVDTVTRKVVGVETLARWQSPTLGLVFPDQFLPVAYDLSAVEDIDALIYETAMSNMQELAAEGFRIDKVSFNVTAQRLADPEFCKRVSNACHAGQSIALEVLESVLVEEQNDVFKFSVDRLRDAGVLIEVDDFGSGHASIIGLMHLAPDALKVDRRLTQAITHDETTLVAIKGIVDIARSMKVKVIAEGVETEEHISLLREVGCDMLQGYAIGKPMPVSELIDFLYSWNSQGSVANF